MNRKEFLKILQEPTRLQNKHVFELEDIIKSFPYFQAARVLHLKGLKIQDSFRYNQSLKTTAIHTTDRSVLFHFITSDVFHESQSSKEEQDIIEEIEQVDKNVLENIEKEDLTENDTPDILEILGIERTEDQTDDIDEKSFEELESELIPTDPTFDTTNRITDDFLITEEEVEELESEVIDDPFEEMVSDDLEKEDHSLETYKADAHIEIEDSDQLDDEITEEVEADTTVEEETHSGYLFEIDTNDQIHSIDTDETPTIESQKYNKDLTINFEIAKEEVDQNTTDITLVQKDELLLEPDIDKPIHFNKDDMHSFSDWMQLSSFKPIDRSSTSKEENSKDNKMDLIDKFIEDNPKIKPNKTTDFTVNFKQVEEIESEEVMTETLARVYTEQQKYGNAIKAYEVLSLKFPEKSSFFADQIQKLKELRKAN